MIATSFLSPRHVRRAALLTFIVSLGLIILALMFGAEVKGARRWIFGLQPSEFIKPAFVVLAAWAFTEGGRSGATAIPAKLLSFLLLPIAIVPLILEPDFGQTMLVAVVWTALFSGGPALVLGGRRRGDGHGRRVRRFQIVPARARARSALSRSLTRRAAWSTRFRWTPRCRAFFLAAGSGGDLARASTSKSSLMRIPTSFSL